ncbi:type IV toxin-antitoxin system AbiEi family antitoxin domain-containing protein [Nocardia asteroides]|uniref:type IV toxin-antitoxin system AbiEi family antitoxin domain-containing protein n=1 Tax=Nocardia asteroides TaxID=1824 RepID=UPI0037C8C273
MSSAAETRSRLAELAESQWGLLTTAQASAIDVDPKQLQRLVDYGVLTRLRYGVYRLAGVPDSPTEPLRAEWLALDPSRTVGERISDELPFGVVSHRSAADLHGLGDLDADYLEFTVPTRRGTRNPDVRFHRALLTPDEWSLVDGLPVTTPARTIGDLAAARTDGGHLASVVRDALLHGVSADEIAEELAPYAHRYGAPVDDGSGLINLFITQAGVPESSLALSAPALQPVIAAKSAFDQALRKFAHGRVLTHLADPSVATGDDPHSAAIHQQFALTRLVAALIPAAAGGLSTVAPGDPTLAALDKLRINVAAGEQLAESVRQAVAPITETPEWAEAVEKISARLQQFLDPEVFGAAAASREHAATILSEATTKSLLDIVVGAQRPTVKAAP